MGIYLNPGSKKFQMARRSEIYVDKTEMLNYLNKQIETETRFICVSRPRRFGKSMAANMIAAFYDRTVDTENIFKGAKITESPDYKEYAGKFDVIQINMQDFLSRTGNVDDLLQNLKKRLLFDLFNEYPNINYFDKDDLIEIMSDIYANTNRPFIIIIDEWDCIFREYRDKKDWQEKYLDFLRAWLKDKAYVGLAYMTGILPIKKYGTHSALNMFYEFSMENPKVLAKYVGFTNDEVKSLCEKYNRDFEECRSWYDGYRFDGVGEVYNPRSVVEAVRSGIYDTYWNQTETFEALKIYIDMNYDGLKETIISLMSGEKARVNTKHFANDMTTFNNKDDVLTLLIHLGYLGYDMKTGSVFVPNNEIMIEYGNAVSVGGWDKITEAVKKSEDLLESTLNKDEEAVAKGIEAAHLETSHLQYNDENALSYTLSLAYYTARQKYAIIRELPTGKGFADLVFLPRPHYQNLPALLLELKWNRSAKTAIEQIKEKNYPASLKDYINNLLIIGISYDKETRKHSCIIEQM